MGENSFFCVIINGIYNKKGSIIMLDLRTRLFLYLTNAHIVELKLNKNIEIPKDNGTFVYVFNSYQEYVDYFKLYLDDIDEKIINLAIYTRGKDGEVVAFKELCDRIIINQRTKEFYDKLDYNKIKEIHNKGKMTPYDKIEELEKYRVCPLEDETINNNRCSFFDNCHECLIEYVSHNMEYDKMYNLDVNKKILKK